MGMCLRRSSGFWVTAIVGAVSLVAASATAAAGSTAGPRPPSTTSASSALAAPSDTGASDITNLGTAGWKVQSSATATQTGAQISTPGFDTSTWLPVANDDAGAPGTEIEALAQNGKCPGDTALQPVNQNADGPGSVFFSNNMQLCYGFMSKIGPDTVAAFDVPWWWRTDFTPNLTAGQTATLIVNGVIGSANVWVNGTQVATSATVTGAYTRFTFNISSLIRSGTNSLAIEVNPNDPTTLFTTDNVDWTQIPPDNNTGISFPVQLRTDGALAVGNSHVNQSDAADLSSAALTVKTDVTNFTATSQTGTVTATVTPPGTGTPITVSQSVTVPASTTQTVSFAPASFPTLTIASPQVWWPYQLGAQPLYTLTTSVAQGGTTDNTTTATFGIRTVTSFLTGSNAIEPSGTRAFKINGVPIVIRGGGFDPNLFLHYSAADTARQIALMKTMGVNSIRLEGHIMPADFFQQLDAAGILVNGGFQCCDAWEVGGTLTQAQLTVLQNSAQTIGTNLRNHPSVFSFQWSDNQPTSQQESASITGFQAADFYPQTPLIASAEYKSTATLGPAGEKEGPYDWVPPDYWYDTTHLGSDSTVTNAGAAWGYDSEESAGNTVPTIDSLNRFMSASDLSNLWQNTKFNQFHTNYEPRCKSGYSFGTLCHFDTALSSRYGSWSSLAQYVEEAQAQNYESVRAQFEAYIDHANNTPLPSTGTIYWQMNKGWPSLLWELYNSDGDQAGSYFGAQEANRTLHALYALDTGTVTLDNLSNVTQSGLSVEAKVYNLAGTLLDDQTAINVSLTSQQVKTAVLTPKVPTGNPVQVYFVELILRQNGALADRNVYWLSTQPDVVNWNKTLGQPQGTQTTYANLTSLQSLPASAVSATAATTHQAGPGGDLTTTVTITNTSGSTVAFLLRADVRRGTATGQELTGDNELQSSIWQGNDITLWPGESQTLTVTYSSADLQGSTPVISVSGWNVPKTDMAAPVP
ncbi:MAG TPA: beta galactosidase jelly roll domain-containing protein [Streptosporangiaceae bacterium]|nr:beta galactosidase jelly roll domain-containing protein [Streptosporangiaceae bacterium]